MILGIGSDLCDIRRIEAALEKFGARFENRVFTAGEQIKARRRKGGAHNSMASTYAKRFAAKEAMGKALGTGVGAGGGIYWRDIEVMNLQSGQPTVRLHGQALNALRSLTPEGHGWHLHLTMTDDYPLAQAFVVIEARPEPKEIRALGL